MTNQPASMHLPRITIIRAMVIVALMVAIGGSYLLFIRAKAPDSAVTSLSGEKMALQSLRDKVAFNAESASATSFGDGQTTNLAFITNKDDKRIKR